MKPKYAYRVRIAKDIIAEVMPPVRVSRKAIVLCLGLPGMPSKDSLLRFLSERGFWVFLPRYRGAWESEGVFLGRSPVKDILDVAAAIRKGRFIEEFGRTNLRCAVSEVYVIGSSFGGAVALSASCDSRIKKIIALSPVVDFTNVQGEDGEWLEDFVGRAFGGAYRSSRSGWKKLNAGTLFNPASEVNHLDPKKIFVMHSSDDEVVGVGPVRGFVRALGCAYREFRKRGHMSAGVAMEPKIWKEVMRFISSKK
jgi:pimeloyl-ACP methyl ester carboxylesterase